MNQSVEQKSATDVGIPGGQEVDRHKGLSKAEFERDYLWPQRPVVICGGFDAWPALGRWTPAYFKERYASKEFSAGGKTYRMDEFVDLVVNASGGETPYLFALILEEHLPELLADVSPPPAVMEPNWLDRPLVPGNMGKRLYADRRQALFIGGRGSAAVVHFDAGYHSFSFQFHGEKRFYLYPPSQTEFLYARPELRVVSEIADVERVDLTRFPKFAETKPLNCVLGPGEMLFIPADWWHGTKVLSPSVSLSVNTANAANWPQVVAGLHEEMKLNGKRFAGAYAAFLRSLGWARSWGARRG